MHHSKNHLDEYCLTFHSRDIYNNYGPLGHDAIPIETIMSYCLRPSDDDNLSSIISVTPNAANRNITFAELRDLNISSEVLLSWFTTIEMAERYQIFLNNDSNLSTDNEVIVHNCTLPPFGPFCRFAFDEKRDESFENVVHSSFRTLWNTKKSRITCYIHLTCRTLLTCLDWRDICDGKQDCADGTDEQNCWELEMNECTDEEYRCTNGQCIPWEFYHDVSMQSECLDQSDEWPVVSPSCESVPTFRCEEETCRPGEREFSCGSGYCIEETSRCNNGRHSFLPMNFCSDVTRCFLEPYNQAIQEWCSMFCPEGECLEKNCSTAFEFRQLPLLFGQIRFIVSNETVNSTQLPLPDYVCYDTMYCPHFPPPTAFFHNLTCHHFDDLELQYIHYNELETLIRNTKTLFRKCSSSANGRLNCNSSKLYQCMNSTKCISKHRLLDGIGDCPFNDDEIYNQSCTLADIRQRFECRNEDNGRCFSSLALRNGRRECTHGEDELDSHDVSVRIRISFQTICDGITHLLPLLIDGRSETDETVCEPWQCNNTYTRCDGIWSCKNGADEVNCSPFNCSTHHHDCVLLNDTSKVSCLPIDRAGDGIDDCLGGTDERSKIIIDYTRNYKDVITPRFRCQNDTTILWNRELCNNVANCPLNDDEAFCQNVPSFNRFGCLSSKYPLATIEAFLCKLDHSIARSQFIFFTLRNVLSYPLQLAMDDTLILQSTTTKSLSIGNDISYNRNRLYSSVQTCDRGVLLHFSAHNGTSSFCLCSPSYYGDRCQYQNQRVSLTLRILLTSDWRNVFVFLITLIDTQTNIESHEHIEYIPSRDCRAKYDIYLLYSTRPKNSSKTFSVRIDAYTDMILKYRASWIFPLQFEFLPVHRLAVVLQVPFSTMPLEQKKCSPTCIHGQCSLYANDQNSNFCRCEPGWSGIRCNTKMKCDCASGAVCVGDSICLCPPGRFGRRCYLSHSLCHSLSCLNGGQCIPVDSRYSNAHWTPTICMCPEGYTGKQCEIQLYQTQIDIYFHHKITIPPSLLVHFIAAQDRIELEPNRTSIAKKLQFYETSLTFNTTTTFNIALAQMFTDYYLIILHEQRIRTTHISTKIIPANRCRPLAELFNHSFTTQHLLKRIKFYHQPCQQHRELMCFHDDSYICLCTLDRSSNCLEFDHNMEYECQKAKYCGDEGECFQDDLRCATASFCACHRCYFGSRCQFSTKGSTLSLDIILGYHIRTKTSIDHEPSIVKTATSWTTIILALGLVNGFLSLQTFRRKEARVVGCGLYLLTTSFVSITIVMVLTLKFAFLLILQMGSIESRWFLDVQCASIDFLLRSLLSMSDWLSVCVAIERVVNAIQGVKFNQVKSLRIARWMIVTVVVLTCCSYIHDPIYRRVVDDEEEQRTWCLTQYPSWVQVLDWTVNALHFFLPFCINIVSAVVIIIAIVRTRSSAQKTKSYKEHFREQLREHKHLLISPLILVALSVPRLVFSFLSGCMSSARQSWFYLIGYHITFIPSIMTLVVFILPSDLYKKEFQGMMKRVWHRLIK